VRSTSALREEVVRLLKRELARQGITRDDPAYLEVIKLFDGVRFALAKRHPEILRKFIQQDIERGQAKKKRIEGASRASIEARHARTRYGKFAEAWKASTVPERNRATVLALKFGWTPKHAREVAQKLGLRN
jgi:hypothetical protein